MRLLTKNQLIKMSIDCQCNIEIHKANEFQSFGEKFEEEIELKKGFVLCNTCGVYFEIEDYYCPICDTSNKHQKHITTSIAQINDTDEFPF